MVALRLSSPAGQTKPGLLERGYLDEAYNCARRYVNRKYFSVMAHLAELLKSEDFSTISLPRSCIRHVLPQEPDSSRETSRVLRVILDKKLLPMTDIRPGDDFKKATWDIAQWMWAFFTTSA
ncbi:hypothetical protein BS47DRAFT_844256 [Hydnum rufescens UP504]|uniref:Uncharacterized protein n=1 Tax=Hydnum rufescens UP504 TaxID=1448309 RepID=A0A9P6AC53_9AGAM|nr:hypothetical protein BS47DRAFT_844256 [Hydnum rufescens UP504]